MQANALPARWNWECLELLLGTLELAADARERVLTMDGPLIAVFRPDHLYLGGSEKPAGLCFEVVADAVEWPGADLFVYFDVAPEGFPVMALPVSIDSQPMSARPVAATFQGRPPGRAGVCSRLAGDMNWPVTNQTKTG